MAAAPVRPANCEARALPNIARHRARPPRRKMAEKNPADLSVWRAIVDAICGFDIGFYPRVDGKENIESLKPKPMQDELEEACKGWETLPATGIDAAIGLAR